MCVCVFFPLLRETVVIQFTDDIPLLRLQVQTQVNQHYAGLFNAVLSIYRQEGVLAFYKGVVAALLVC